MEYTVLLECILTLLENILCALTIGVVVENVVTRPAPTATSAVWAIINGL